MDSAVSDLPASNSLGTPVPDEKLHVLEVAIIHPDSAAGHTHTHVNASQENSDKQENSLSLSVTLSSSSITVLQIDQSIKVTDQEAIFSQIGPSINKNTFTKPNMPTDRGQQESKLIVDIKQGGSSSSDVDVENKDDKTTDEDKAYESEPASLDKSDNRKKLKNRTFRGKQGKTMYPRPRSNSKEMRELSRKHALLEKNLKIEGLPDPPKFRKRRLSLSSNMGRPHDKDVQFKRKRLGSVDLRPRRDHMPKWELMGGDAHDPLNLNGLAHSEEGRLLNLKTPESSPLPTPDFRKIVYVKVPPNIEDPLNLEGKHDQKVIDRLLNSTIKKRHRSKKKKHEDLQQAGPSGATCTPASESVCGTDIATDVESESHCEITPIEEDTSIKKPKSIDVPTPTKSNTFNNSRSRSRSLSMSPERKFKRQLSGSKSRTGPNEPTKFPEKPMFTLGNYNRYYGYRNRDHEPDPRLQYFNPTWFKDKDVLDIGCNVGHITLALAEQYHPHKILGMDIDGKLIQAARQNIRHMLSLRRKDSSKYPRVFEMTKGPLEAHPLMGSSDQFPNNVLFLQGNYVPGSEEILNLQKEEYDIILALSITKWIHLNNGDNGLKLFFQKIFRQLRPGGRLILEPQPWSTYRKRAKLSSELFAKYQSIKLKPEGFKHYLLSIGFVKCEVIGVPVTKAKGFRRPLILFTKADSKQTPSLSLSEELDYRDVCQECGSTNKSECEHPQFTGMRRGPYASHMYDHINYPTNASSDSPYLNTQRTCASFSFNNVDDGDATPMEISATVTERCDPMDETLDNSISNFGSDSLRGLSVLDADSKFSSSSRSQVSNISHSISGSEHSCTSSSSSGSGSTGSSTVSSSSSCYSPNPNGPNGDIASDVEYSPSLNGPNGDVVGYSPNLNGLNGDIADDMVDADWPQESVAGFLPVVPNSEIVADSPELNEPIVNIVENVWDENSDDVGVVVTAGEGEGSSNEVAVLDEEEDQALPGPIANVGHMNGDHNVVQHWDNDNQDANIDAPVGIAHPPDLSADSSGTTVVGNTDNGL
ncbi:unnamed protein product [Lymnaea stagnalis]|uniref:RNA methyltransferase n=1 Tax=Lymnaea stagnalis TaxID=6523 RepID=A0AAV2IHD1_LYMST